MTASATRRTLTEDEQRARGCTDKKRFTTRRYAKHAARLTRNISGEHLRPYQCRFCEQWHLGHLNGGTGLRAGRRNTATNTEGF